MEVGGALLRVRVRRHAASRRYRLRYDSLTGELRLTMPPRQRIAPARAWVKAQGAWIAGQMARPSVTPMAVGPAAQLPWNGGQIQVDWAEDRPRAPRLAGDRLLVGGPRAAVAARVRRWLVDHAREEFSARSTAMAHAAGLALAGVSVGDPRSRWGSCSAARHIRYSWRLVMAPDHVRHAIVAHEVAHLAHMNHGPDFRALELALGGQSVALSRAWLRAHGRSLHAPRFD